jgi:hypothetical protein
MARGSPKLKDEKRVSRKLASMSCIIVAVLMKSNPDVCRIPENPIAMLI